MKRGRLEIYVIIILFIGLVFFVTWRLNLFESPVQQIKKMGIERDVELWMANAKEDLKVDFLFMEGKNYFFAKGKLESECTEFDSESHCPISIRSTRINGNKLFMDEFRFAFAAEDIFPYPLSEGINAMGFSSKEHNENASLEFDILDYIPNTDLCESAHDKGTLCNVYWTKRISPDEPVQAGDLPVEVKDFDYSLSGQMLSVSLNGEIESDDTPDVTLAFYRELTTKKSRINEIGLDLRDENGVYAFEFDGVFNMSRPEEGYSVLLLVTGEDSFHAREWVFDNGEVVNSFVYD